MLQHWMIFHSCYKGNTTSCTEWQMNTQTGMSWNEPFFFFSPSFFFPFGFDPSSLASFSSMVCCFFLLSFALSSFKPQFLGSFLMLFYHVSFHPFIFHSDLMSFLSSIIWIQGNLFMRQSIHTPPHKGPQSLFFVIQVVYNSWKWLLYTVNTGWYCYIALRLLQQIKTHGSHTKMLSELWNWVIECNWL